MASDYLAPLQKLKARQMRQMNGILGKSPMEALLGNFTQNRVYLPHLPHILGGSRL